MKFKAAAMVAYEGYRMPIPEGTPSILAKLMTVR